MVRSSLIEQGRRSPKKIPGHCWTETMGCVYERRLCDMTLDVKKLVCCCSVLCVSVNRFSPYEPDSKAIRVFLIGQLCALNHTS